MICRTSLIVMLNDKVFFLRNKQDTLRLFFNYARPGPGTRQGQAGTIRDKVGTSRDKEGLSMGQQGQAGPVRDKKGQGR